MDPGRAEARTLPAHGLYDIRISRSVTLLKNPTSLPAARHEPWHPSLALISRTPGDPNRSPETFRSGPAQRFLVEETPPLWMRPSAPSCSSRQWATEPDRAVCLQQSIAYPKKVQYHRRDR